MRKKRVLVTGADGFIGSHLTELLFQSNYDVTALVQYNSFNSVGNLSDVYCKDKINIIAGDIRDLNFCKNISKDIEIVFHLAALIAIPYSYVAPSSYVETNVLGTLNVCQAALTNGVNRVINVSTSEVYGTAHYIPIDENHPLQPQSPYSASKISSESMAMSFFNSFNLPVTTVRPFNTYGPRQSARAIMPTIISQIAAGEKQIKLGSLYPTRDFNYVTDTCNGLLAVSNCNELIGKIVNIGSNSEISIKELFNKIREIISSDAEIIEDGQRVRPKKSEVDRLKCDNSMVKKYTNFKSEVNLEEGLKKTISWMLIPENLIKYNAAKYNI